jgi:uncharacterized protein YjbJ (UPF0337 family)
METKLKIKGNWNELKAKLQKKYPKLTDSDLVFTKGNEDDLVENISERLGKTEEEVNDIIDDLQSEKSKPGSEKSKTESHKTEIKKKQK